MDDAPDQRTPAARSGGMVAWAIIGLCVAVALWSAFIHPERHGPQPGTSGGLSPLELQVRAVVGADQVSSALGATLLKQFDAELTRSGERLHLVVVAGEVVGPADALTRLAALVDDAALVADRELLGRLYRDGAGSLREEERTWLRARLGWTAELALVHGLPSSDSGRVAVLAQASRTTRALAIANGMIAALVLGGSVAAIVLIVRWRQGRLRAAYPTPLLVAVRHPTACIEGFAVYLLTYTAFGMLVHSLVAYALIPDFGMSAVWLYLPLVPLMLIATVRRGMTWKDLRQAIGWHTGRGVLREIAAGVLGWLAALPLLVAALFVAMLLNRYYPASHPIEQMLAGADAATLFALLAVASVFAPLVEETMFRGLLFHHLRTRWAWLPAALLTSGIFAALHPQGVAALPTLTTIALVMAALRAWRGSLIAPVAAHALNNGVAVMVVVLLQG